MDNFDYENFLSRISFGLDVDYNINDFTNSSISFGKVFSHLFGCTSEYVFQTLKSPTFLMQREFYLRKEYSHQRLWIDETSTNNEPSEFFPLLYSCASICHAFQYDVILVCGLLNLSFIHKSHRIIKISSERSNGNFVVIGLDDANIFKVLKYYGTHEHIIQLISDIPDYCIISLDEDCFDDDRDALPQSRFDSFRRMTNNMDEFVDDNIEKLTIRQYLNNQLRCSSNGLKVHESSFDNNHKIDIHGSDFRFEHEYLVSFQRTLDIDAFFGLFTDFEFQECLAGGGKIISFKDMTKNKREIASIKKILEDSGMTNFTKFKCIKFAELDSPSLFEVFAVAAGSTSSLGFENFDLKSWLQSAHFYANRYPCISNNCIHSIEHATVRNGRPDFHTQIKTHTFKWDYQSNSFKCLIRAMLSYLRNGVSSYDGVNIFYYVKCIGSKFKTIFISLNQFDQMIKKFLFLSSS